MDTELFAALVRKSQLGDADALEQLLLEAYTPVSYLAEKILPDPHAAQQVLRESLETISAKLDSLSEPEQFENWMLKMTAARCVQAMPLRARPCTEAGAPVWQNGLTDGQILTEAESARIIQKMVDALPERQRLCILLLCCGGLGIHAIAQVTGFSTDTVKESINQGQSAIQDHLWALQSRKIQLTGMTSLGDILRIAMYRKPEDEDPIPLIYDILGKEIPVPPDPGKLIIRVLTVILLLLIMGILVTGSILLMKLLS